MAAVRPQFLRISPSRLALIALLLVTQAGAYLHQVALDHRVCVEHGELLEGSAAESHRHELGAAAEGVHAAGAVAEDAHHACASFALLREPSRTSPAVTVELPTAPSSPALPVLVARVAASPVAIHRLAPKTSPPA